MQNSLLLAYRGEGLFRDVPVMYDGGATFNKVLADDKTRVHPWFIDYQRSEVVTLT